MHAVPPANAGGGVAVNCEDAAICGRIDAGDLTAAGTQTNGEIARVVFTVTDHAPFIVPCRTSPREIDTGLERQAIANSEIMPGVDKLIGESFAMRAELPTQLGCAKIGEINPSSL